jgi:hypothetical protein
MERSVMIDWPRRLFKVGFLIVGVVASIANSGT